jgi:hypothetical protein
LFSRYIHATFPPSPAASLVLALCAGSALAADNGKISTLGNASAKAPVMSRDELRVCLQQDALKARAEDAKAKRAQLDVERKQLEADKEAIAPNTRPGGPHREDRQRLQRQGGRAVQDGGGVQRQDGGDEQGRGQG